MHDNNNQLTLKYEHPTFAEGNNVWYYNTEVTSEVTSYIIDYPYWTIEKIGIRLSLDEVESTDGRVLVKILSEDGKTEYASDILDYSEIANNELNYFNLSCDILPGKLQILISCEGSNILAFGVNESDSNGNVVYDGLEVHFVVSYVPMAIITISIMFILLLLVLFTVVIMQKRLSYEQIFVLGYVFWGAMFFVILSPLAECDAGNHIRRIMSILQGHLIGITDNNNQIGAYISWPSDWQTGDSVNISLYQIIHELNFHIGSYNEKFMTYTNVALYSPFSYITALVGALLGRFITTRIVFIILAARVFNFICTGALMYIAIKFAPYGKRYICMIIFLLNNLGLVEPPVRRN